MDKVNVSMSILFLFTLVWLGLMNWHALLWGNSGANTSSSEASNASKCLFQLNVPGKRKMILNDQETICGTSNPEMEYSYICIPRSAKYLIARKAKECDDRSGYWVCDPTGCLRQFIPYGREQLHRFLNKMFQAKWNIVNTVQAEVDPSIQDDENRLIFYGDACELDSDGQHLRCNMDRIEGEDESDPIVVPITRQSSNSVIQDPAVYPEAKCTKMM